MTYYLIVALLTTVGFPFAILPLYFKYRTLQYRFDDKGISMSYGVLFKREIYLTYRRVQDIHVTRNFIQRWLGLSTVSVQTAAGSSSAEMTIEGILQPELLRDYLYQKMRGAHDVHPGEPQTGSQPLQWPASSAPADEALALLRDIRDQLRNIRTSREARP